MEITEIRLEPPIFVFAVWRLGPVELAIESQYYPFKVFLCDSLAHGFNLLFFCLRLLNTQIAKRE